MKNIFIDGDQFCTLNEFFSYMSGILMSGADNFHISSLDALADSLEGGFGFHDYNENIEIKWKNAKKSRLDLGSDETVKYFENILKESNPNERDEIREQIIFSQTEESYTLFFIILDMFMEVENVISVQLY